MAVKSSAKLAADPRMEGCHSRIASGPQSSGPMKVGHLLSMMQTFCVLRGGPTECKRQRIRISLVRVVATRLAISLCAVGLLVVALWRVTESRQYRLVRDPVNHLANRRALLASNETVAQLAKYVFSPKTIVRAASLDREQLTEMFERLRPRGKVSLSLLLHAIHLYGTGLSLHSKDGEGSATALDVLLDARLGREYFDGALPLAATRYGARAPVYRSILLGTSQPSVEAHPGQLLSTLASAGVPATRPICFGKGHFGVVGDVVQDIVANFTLDGEIQWDVVALAVYLRESTWENRWGSHFAFDGVVADLLNRDPRTSSCGGTHNLIALTVILKSDDIQTRLSENVRKRLTDHLSETVRILEQNQRSNGSWDLNWNAPRPTKETPGSEDAETMERVLVTGHHLEWLLIVPPQLAPRQETLRSAADWLSTALSFRLRNNDIFGPDYCPLVHAVRALGLLTTRQNGTTLP